MELAIVSAVHADVNDVSIRFVLEGLINQGQTPDSHDNQIRMGDIELHILTAGFAMELGNIAILGKEQLGHWLANDVASSDDHRILTGEFETFVGKIIDDSLWGARNEVA